MEGIIEFHGAKQMFISGDIAININNTINDFINGDKVLYNDKDKIILLKRQEQAVIGIVKNMYKGHAFLHITNFSSVCKYSPKIKNNGYNLGDRLVIWLHSNGEVSVRNKYSLDNIDDVKCLLDMYSLMPSNKRNEENEEIKYVIILKKIYKKDKKVLIKTETIDEKY